jgi:hypothetical protein
VKLAVETVPRPAALNDAVTELVPFVAVGVPTK